uniref:C-type lectin domain-containing protein n=1 Tax=Acrobeloides nanus TaxID=290746 RepID=A0A914CHC7_9BILA
MDCHANHQGANLVSIHSAVEESVILGFATARDSPALLGLTDKYKNGTYSWADGSKLDYSNWNVQPGVDECVFLSVKIAQWYPMPCKAFNEYLASEICEIQATS